MNITDLANSSDRASEFLKSLANAQRLRILCLIMEGEQPVGKIAEAIGANRFGLVWRSCGEVVPRRSGRPFITTAKKADRMFRLLGYASNLMGLANAYLAGPRLHHRRRTKLR
jgi:DNA-binding transcriptional ArsR family regulator